MDTRWLYDFLALTETGSFTQAASYRNCSQAAFSRRMQSLENWAGAKLIDRSVYPVQLTEAGQKLHTSTLSLTNQLEDARAELALDRSAQSIKVALTYALATEKLPAWWRHWAQEGELSCITLVGNILETTSAFTAGLADILITYSHPIQPGFRADQDTYEKIVIGVATLSPYCSQELVDSSAFQFPGTPEHPVPLLRYANQSYFSKVVQNILDRTDGALHAKTVFESEMSTVLSGAAQQGLGVAWLTDDAGLQEGEQELVSLDDTADQIWSENIEIVAYCAQPNRRKHVRQLWKKIGSE